ncbi:DNA polymerase III subunit delta' [Bartonella sp. LJL80]
MTELNIPRQYDDIDGVLLPSQNTLLFGHSRIVDFLSQIRREGHLHHALLFEGPQGIGKATLAFQLAWNVISNMSTGFVQPDQSSNIWRQIAQGSHPAVAHISRRFDVKTEKFKTGISVEDIRDVHHLLNQTSHDGGWRVVIVDPADDMNRNAANAILKTLEEPPAKTLFILISHFAGRLLPTIRSRCHAVNFRTLGSSDMKKALEHVLPNHLPAQSELDTVIKKSNGSVRKAALLLCYGGLEISRTQDEILSQKVFDPGRAQSLGHALSGREATVQFQQFCDDLLDRIAQMATADAEAGNISASNRHASLWRETSDEIAQTEAFNLDKKQFVINLLFKLHKVLHP